MKEGVQGICFVGMGGSSIAGNYVRALLSEESRIPIVVVRNYSLPMFVDNTWVVIAISYSGNTEETLAAVSSAEAIGARIVTLTSGGKMAQEDKYPTVRLPKDFQPRAALPIIFSIALPIAETLSGLTTSKFGALENILTENATMWGKWIQSPHQLAKSLIRKIPLFIGSRHLTPVAYRAKCQINENSKALAFQSELPESNHNEIESFVSTYGCSIKPIFLRSCFESRALHKRFDVTLEIYNEMGLNPLNIEIKGETKLEEMLLQTHFLDMVSVEYAILREVNPISVDKIEDLKRRLSKD
jgi:glucose/mannose-6-phosphate isomerase